MREGKEASRWIREMKTTRHPKQFVLILKVLEARRGEEGGGGGRH